MKTVSSHLRDRLLQGVRDEYPDINNITRGYFSYEFIRCLEQKSLLNNSFPQDLLQYMKNRVILGTMRYGMGKPYEYVSVCGCLRKLYYKIWPNVIDNMSYFFGDPVSFSSDRVEFIIDYLNYCMLGFSQVKYIGEDIDDYKVDLLIKAKSMTQLWMSLPQELRENFHVSDDGEHLGTYSE
jgi:hypothetical protein